ncbi:D-lactate dehydrogenase [Klebsiella michiganensis]|nr:D-lactate dehydrogenase [Klebsiella michiganensis]
MKIAVYSTKQYDKKYLQHVNDAYGFELEFFDFLLTEKTAKTANGCEAVCIFVNDDGSRPGTRRTESPRREVHRAALRGVSTTLISMPLKSWACAWCASRPTRRRRSQSTRSA